MMIIKKGLDLPLKGEPEQVIYDALPVTEIALLGEYIGLKPTLSVVEGDIVKKGQVLFFDKNDPNTKYTAPIAGEVVKINRGDCRVLQSVVIKITDSSAEKFPTYAKSSIDSLKTEDVRKNLLNSGLWTAFRTRPFSKVPKSDSIPAAIFITAMDTRPHAPNPAVIINSGRNREFFETGLTVLSKLEVELFLCTDDSTKIPTNHSTVKEFQGPHPAGLPGTHIHFVMPASTHRTLWHIGYQDVISIGALFLTGELHSERIISIAGPKVQHPRLIRTLIGANILELVTKEDVMPNCRVINGSVFHGKQVTEEDKYLSRYNMQISILEEGNKKEFFGWLGLGINKFSFARIFISAFNKKKKFDLTTSTGGSPRAMVPIGQYERVMPLDILATLLLRDLIVGDVDEAAQLGVLELDEEDLALCTFVCPGKYDYGIYLRDCLEIIEKDGI